MFGTQFFSYSYFKNGERQENGELKCSIQACVEDFRNAFPNFPVDNQKRNNCLVFEKFV
jgi:hypothetical protein